jgi:DNA-binding transcriptional regulator YdaS (Cro superfamily)
MATATTANPLTEILDVFGLSQSELADLFAVRQPSLAQWIAHGVPAKRRASVEAFHDLALALTREVIPSRIPEIVRRKDAWLGNRSMLEVMRADGPEPVWTYLARLFRYAG